MTSTKKSTKEVGEDEAPQPVKASPFIDPDAKAAKPAPAVVPEVASTPTDRPPAQELYQAPAFDMTAYAKQVNEGLMDALQAEGMDYWAGMQTLEHAKVLLGPAWTARLDEQHTARVVPGAKETPQEAAAVSQDTTVIQPAP